MKKTLKIEGMCCEHCVENVERVLKETEGVKEVKVSLEENNAVVEVCDSVKDETLKNAVEDAGFDVVEII